MVQLLQININKMQENIQKKKKEKDKMKIIIVRDILQALKNHNQDNNNIVITIIMMIIKTTEIMEKKLEKPQQDQAPNPKPKLIEVQQGYKILEIPVS